MSCMYNLNNTSFVQSEWILFPETFQRKIIFTVHNEVAKVMFLHQSVCPRGDLPQCMLRYHPPPREQTHLPPRADPLWSGHPPEQTPLPADGYCCGRYASYWKAFLFWMKINLTWTHCIRLHKVYPVLHFYSRFARGKRKRSLFADNFSENYWFYLWFKKQYRQLYSHNCRV